MTSSELFAEARRYIPGGVNSPVRAFRGVGGEPFFVERASGAHIWDVEGREYIDYVGTWGPAILGHAPRVIEEAVAEAALRAALVSAFRIRTKSKWRGPSARWMPSIEKVRMVNSGTEATMSCIRLARGCTGRDRIIKFEGCYHGHVDSLLVKAGSGALTHGQPDSAGVPAALAELTITLPFNDTVALRSVFMAEGSKIAAVIVEPVPANAGLYLPEEGFLEVLRQQCSQYGAVLIFDEVMTGFRLARGGYQERCGISPDLTALGKVIGGGLPVGAFGGRADLMDQLSPEGPVYQAGTLSGNPHRHGRRPGATAANSSASDGWARLETLGAGYEERVRACLRRLGLPWQFQRIGSMFCLYFTSTPVRDLATAQTSDRSLFARFFHGCLEAGVYFAPSQFEAGFLSLAHTSEDLDKTAEVTESVLKSLS